MVEMKEKSNDSLVKGALSLTVSVLIVKVIGFIYKLPLSYVLGDEGMGYFNSAYTIFTFFYMLCTGGVPRAVSILVTEMKVKENYYAINKILSSALRIFVLIGATFSVSLLLFSDFFAKAIGNSLSSFSLFLIAPSLTFVSASGVFRGYLNGNGRMLPIAVSEVIEGAIKFVLGLALALLGKRLGYENQIISGLAILGVSIGSFVGALFLSICAKINKNEYKTKQNTQNNISTRETIFKILKISVPITLSAAIMGISNIIDLGMIMKRLIATGMSDAEAVALYGNFTTLAIPMVNLIMAIISPISSAALPHMTAKHTMKNMNDFGDFIANIFMFVSFVASPFFFAYLLFSQEILFLLFKDASASVAAPLLTVLSPAVLFMPFLTISNTALEASSKPKLSLISMIIGALIKLAAGYILIGKIGIYGAPLSSVISYAVSLVVSLFFTERYAKVKLSVLNKILPPFLIAGVSVGSCRIAYIALCGGTYNVVIFLIFAALSALMYILLSVIFMKNDLALLLKSVKFNKKHEKSL